MSGARCSVCADLSDIPEGAVEAAWGAWVARDPVRGAGLRGILSAALAQLASTPEGRAYLLRLVSREDELNAVDDPPIEEPLP